MPFTYIAPRALHAHPTGGYNWFPVGVENGAFRFEAQRMTEAVDSLATFIAAAAERYQADPRRVVFVGYSQGGGLALAYLLRHPDTVMGAVATADALFDEARPWGDANRLADKVLFIGHGTLDPLINSAELQRTRTFFENLGADVTYREYRIPHVVSQAEIRDIEAWLWECLSS